MDPPGIRYLAAKFSRVPDVDRWWHPLICHMIDVASVAEALWDDGITPSSREAVAADMGLTLTQTRGWVAFLAGAHDLGKATRVFQAKDPRHAERMTGSGFHAMTHQKDPGHGTVTADALRDILVASPFSLGRNVAIRLATLTGGHHGRFPTIRMMREGRGRDIGEDDRHRSAWTAGRSGLVERLAAHVGLDRSRPRSISNAHALLLAGLVSVADWIGSREDIFPFDPDGPDDLDAYSARARGRAAAALSELHWSVTRAATTDLLGFTDYFPGRRPYPIQEAVSDLARRTTGPSLMVIEAPMGEGKTEAALYVSEAGSSRGLRGAYLGLPTRATANQLHERVRRHLEQTHPGQNVNLVLEHGGRTLAVEDRGRATLPSGVMGEVEGELAGSIDAAAWFVRRKRALLAPYGVGTIDQALLAALQTRHVFVRLFGLAGKTIIVDEVHAYDTYMSQLLEGLLCWLGALGTSVVLLSATLPASRRNALMEAFARGADGTTANAPVSDTPYPRVTWYSEGSMGAVHVPAAARSRRILRLERLVPESAEVGRFLAEQLRNGGCAAVICNTVRSAQAMFATLREMFQTLPEAHRPGLTLFHARFVQRHREERERQITEWFGPGSSDRPDRWVVVATQVIEQSLDLDFDVMVSEMAPIDLLLQRSGRLQRHARGDRVSPALCLMWPDGSGGFPIFDRGTRSVYDEHVLLRTWYALLGRSHLRIPEDIESLIEFVYPEASETGVPADASPALAAHWEATWNSMQRARAADTRQADDRVLPGPHGPEDIYAYTEFIQVEDDQDLHPVLRALTRLGADSVDVVVMSGDRYRRMVAQGAYDAREMLAWSVAVSNPAATRVLRRKQPEPGFKEDAALRAHRLLVCDGDYAIEDGARFSYDPDLGLSIDWSREASG